MTGMIQVGWRNLWRNRQRSAISIFALAVGTTALVFVDALWAGFASDIVHSVTRGGSGEVQVHGAGYEADQSVYRAVRDPGGLLRIAREHGLSATARVIGFGLVAHGAKSAGVRIVGVDPAGEREVGALPEKIREGRYLSPVDPHAVVAGFQLVRSIGASVGDDIILVVQAADGSTSSARFRLEGILQPVGEIIDRAGIFLHRDTVDSLFAMEGRVHELVVQSNGTRDPTDIVTLLRRTGTEDSIRPWREFNMQAASMVDVILAMISIIQSFFYVAAALGVTNTMLMATFERTREFGLMKALGCPPRTIVLQVAAEAGLLGIVGCSAGAAVGSLVVSHFGETGIDAGRFIGSFSAGGLVFDNVWHPLLEPAKVPVIAVILCSVVVVASLYPALRAARVSPCGAMSHV